MALRPNYFHVSQAFWHDPEIRELGAEHGLEMVVAWQEILARSDRSDGFLKLTVEQLAKGLVNVVSNPRHRVVRASSLQRRLIDAITWMMERGFIRETTNGLQVCNYWKYHWVKLDKRRSRQGDVRRASAPPSEPSEPIKRNSKEKGSMSNRDRSSDPLGGGPSRSVLEGPKEGEKREMGEAVKGLVDGFLGRSPKGPVDVEQRRRELAEQARILAEREKRASSTQPTDTPPTGDELEPPEPPGEIELDPPGDPAPAGNGADPTAELDPGDPLAALRHLEGEEFEAEARRLIETAELYGLKADSIRAEIERLRKEEIS